MKKILLAGLVALLGVTGCSSSDDAQTVAVAMCELAKKGDVEGMKKYADPEFAEALEQVNVMVKAALATEYGKSEFEKNVALLKDVNCKETTQITDIGSDAKSVSNYKTSQIFVLRRVSGEWKVVAQ